LKQGRQHQALIKYLWAAQMGFEIAQYNAAFMLDQNNDPDSYLRALMLYNRSAVQGNSKSRVKVGDYFYYGRAVNANYKLAAMHYQSAEQDKNAEAMFNIGYMYENGIGFVQVIIQN
jgi:SEL1 protein